MSEPEIEFPPMRREQWIKGLFAVIALSLITNLVMFLIVGPEGLSRERRQQMQDQQLAFYCLILMGTGIAAIGIRGVATGIAENVNDESVLPKYFQGRSARLIGSLQVLAGSILIGGMIYLLFIG
jgi:hypothetical protein